MRPAVVRVVALAMAFAATSCAKFPSGPTTQNTHLIFTMTVAGHIRNGRDPNETPYYYIVAVNPSTDLFPTEVGPEPVAAPPWGNGFVFGTAPFYVEYYLPQGNPYLVYQFLTPQMLQSGATGPPISGQDPGLDGNPVNTIQFEVDMSQFTPTNGDPNAFQSIQVNFLTMDRIPAPGYTGRKFWDALGDENDPNSVNDYIRIPLTSSQVFSNSSGTFSGLEPEGDCSDPDLDIVSWSVEVRKP